MAKIVAIRTFRFFRRKAKIMFLTAMTYAALC
jgi:hypothetical protein